MLPNLSSKVAWVMSMWAFYHFKQWLHGTAERWGMTIINIDEAYTSKTCSQCGTVKAEVKGRVFECDGCGLVMDCDVHTTRNIYLKNMHLVMHIQND